MDNRSRHLRRRAASAAIGLGAAVALVVPSLAPADAADSWQTEVIAPTTSDDIAVALDAEGNAVAFWDDANDDTYGSRRPAGGSWTTPAHVTGSAWDPVAALLAPNGDGIFDGTGEYDFPRLVTWHDDGTTGGGLAGVSSSHYSYSLLYTDPDDDDLVIVGVDEEGAPPPTTFYLRRPDETVFSAVVRSNTMHPTVAFTGGHDFAFADVVKGNVIRVVGIDSSAGRAAQLLRRDAGCAEPQHLSLKLDARGRGAVAWQCRGDNGRRTIRAVYVRPDGASRTADVVTTRAAPGSGPLLGPTVAAAPGGVVTLLYGPQPASGASVRVKSRGPASGWSKARVLADAQQELFGLGMRSAKSGAAIISWADGTTVRAILRRPDGRFGAPATVTEAPAHSMPDPRVTRDGDGFIVVRYPGGQSPVTVYTSPGS